VRGRALPCSAEGGWHHATLGAEGLRCGGLGGRSARPELTTHVAQNTSGRRSAIDGRTTRHPGYPTSQRLRKRIEECFGWIKTVGGLT
jgi:hypothetical protein